MTYLMCKETPIYNQTTDHILQPHLLPAVTAGDFSPEAFKKWRYFLSSNGASRQLVQDTPNWIDKKRRFSLSDCYWYKQDGDNATFATHSPYLNPFSTLAQIVLDSSMPAQTLTGSFTKEWFIHADGTRKLRKVSLAWQMEAEVECYRLASILGLRMNHVQRENEQSVIIDNLTDPQWMLLDYKVLGVKVNGFSPIAINSVYGHDQHLGDILNMVLFDAVVGNTDREKNMGNLAIYKHAETGQMKLPPMFDFNLAKLQLPHYFLAPVAKQLQHDNLSQQALAILTDWQPRIPHPQWLSNCQELMGLLAR